MKDNENIIFFVYRSIISNQLLPWLKWTTYF